MFYLLFAVNDQIVNTQYNCFSENADDHYIYILL